MILSSTLNRYLARTYFLSFLTALALLMSVIFLFETLELLRRSGRFGVPLRLVIEMAFLKLPEVGQIILPFAVLFSALFTFWKLNRRSELIVIRASGFSVWQFLAPVLGVGFAIGIVYLVLINPIGAAMLSRYEALENKLIFHRTSAVTLLQGGLWLRQDQQDGQRIILHAEKIDRPGWVLHDVMVLYFDQDDRFQRRLDAPRARLSGQEWKFDNPISTAPGQRTETVDAVTLPTDLTPSQIEESFSSPGTVSFWQMPAFIQTLQQTGFDATNLRVHFNVLLAQPLMFAAMILLAASVSLRPPRLRGAFAVAVIGMIGGFLLFFAASFLQALGTSHQIPVLAASWAAPLAATLIGAAVILNFEDG